MMPPKIETNYEKVPTTDFVAGIIEDIAYDMEHRFKAYKKDEQDRIKPAVRLKFKLNGCEYPHYSRWMTFTYGSKSTLFLKYLLPLVEGATPDMKFDLDLLKGMQVKTLWVEKDGFQSVENIRPLGNKLAGPVMPEVSAAPRHPDYGQPLTHAPDERPIGDDEVPF